MKYDVIIIGSGPAGISAGLYTTRANLKTLIISAGIGTLKKAEKIENYYGIENPISGEELEKIGLKQAEKLGTEITIEQVVKIDYEENLIIETINNKYETNNLIIATGNSKKTIDIEGINELEGKGISYCATCDAFLYKDKEVAVIGSGEYAIHELEEIKRVTDKVTLLTNSEKITKNRSNEIKIDERKIKKFIGNDKIEEIEFEDNKKKKIDGVFIAIGNACTSDLAKKIGIKTDDNGYIIVDKDMKTNIPNIYACGDCTGGIFQISKAVYEGMIAGMSTIKNTNRKENKIGGTKYANKK